MIRGNGVEATGWPTALRRCDLGTCDLEVRISAMSPLRLQTNVLRMGLIHVRGGWVLRGRVVSTVANAAQEAVATDSSTITTSCNGSRPLAGRNGLGRGGAAVEAAEVEAGEGRGGRGWGGAREDWDGAHHGGLPHTLRRWRPRRAGDQEGVPVQRTERRRGSGSGSSSVGRGERGSRAAAPTITSKMCTLQLRVVGTSGASSQPV
jgi:hypothetical protein